MPTTKYKIAEAVRRRLVGGDPSIATKIHIEEVILAVEQCANVVLKLEAIGNSINLGDIIPSGTVIATYEDVEVVRYLNTSKITLPAMPVNLPRGLGLFEIFMENNPDCIFIPIESGQNPLLRSQNEMLSGLLGQVGYSRYGLDVVFTEDLTVDGEDVYVWVRLIVMDFSRYGQWDPLPLTPDMEKDLMEMVFNMFAPEPVKDKLVDPGVKEQTGVPINQQGQG